MKSSHMRIHIEQRNKRTIAQIFIDEELIKTWEALIVWEDGDGLDIELEGVKLE
jgi:hypothetical protein